jgi:hypothetical protein
MTEQLSMQLQEPVALAGWDDPVERRGFLQFMGKVGLAAIGATSGLVALTHSADAASPCTCSAPNYACCSLNKANNCPTDLYGNRYCPNGTIGFEWTCCFCTGTRTYACLECVYSQGNGTCCQNASNTYCSAYWTVSANSCTCGAGCGCDGQTRGCLA